MFGEGAVTKQEKSLAKTLRELHDETSKPRAIWQGRTYAQTVIFDDVLEYVAEWLVKENPKFDKQKWFDYVRRIR